MLNNILGSNRKSAMLFSLFLLCGINTVFAQELRFWNFWDPKFILPVIADFEAQNPGVKIRNEQLNWGNGLDKIITALANGLEPDICELGSTWMGKFMAEGAFLDITDEVRDCVDQYLFWEPATWQGRFYGMPWLVGTRVLFYNRELFRRYGLDPDKPPVTWSEMIDASRCLHHPKAGIYGFGVNAGEGHILYKKFLPFAWGIGGRIIDESGRFIFNTPQVREAFDAYQSLMQYGLKEKQDVLDDAFKRGKLGMAISGSWNFAKYPKESPELDFGVALIPKHSHEKGFHASFLGGQVLTVFKKCRHKDIAARFIRFLVKAENTLPITKEALVSFPANITAFADPFFTEDPRLSVFVEQMKTGIHPPIHPLWIELEQIINETVEKVLYGEDIDTALNAAEAEYDRISKRSEHSAATGQTCSVHERQDSQNSVWSGIALYIITFGTILNTILLILIIRGQKKNL